MTSSVFGSKASAVTTEADYFPKNVPILFFPDQDTWSRQHEEGRFDIANGWTPRPSRVLPAVLVREG